MISSFFAPFLPRYRDRHPGIDVRLIEGGRAQQQRYLERGDVHLATLARVDSRFARRMLGPLHLLAVLPKRHRLGRRATMEIDELAEEPLLLMQHGYGAREMFDAACQTAHVTPRVMMEGTVGGTLIDLAAEGYGVAVINSTALIRHPELRGVVLVNRGVAVGQWMMVCWDPQRLMPPYGQQFIDDVVSYARRSFPGRGFNRRAPLPQLPKRAEP
jgi:DNA-binding transcriptional LysR family regulator